MQTWTQVPPDAKADLQTHACTLTRTHTLLPWWRRHSIPLLPRSSLRFHNGVFLLQTTCLINALKEIHESDPWCYMLIHSSVLMDNKQWQSIYWAPVKNAKPGNLLTLDTGTQVKVEEDDLEGLQDSSAHSPLTQLPGLPPPPPPSQFPPHTLFISLHKKPHSLFAQYTFTIDSLFNPEPKSSATKMLGSSFLLGLQTFPGEEE